MTVRAIRMTAAACAAAAMLMGTAGADPRGPEERHEHVDARHGHNHSYPDLGVSVAAVPRGAYAERLGKDRYWFHEGVWYRADGPRYVVVAPPAGIVVEVLPPFYTTVVFGRVQYYYANDAYYVYDAHEGGYRIVPPPPLEAGPQAAPLHAGIYVYPRNGQPPAQQAADRAECERWAVAQSHADPAAPPGASPESEARRADYARALGACLDARGYATR